MNLATLGNWLRQEGADLGEWKLSDLIRTAPGYGEIEAGTIVFGAGEPPGGEEGAVDPYAGVTLQHDLFQAMTADLPGEQAYLHVRTCKVQVVAMLDDAPGPPVSEADFEYVRVPTLRTAEQREFAREWLTGKVTPDQLSYILGGEDFGWVHRGRATADPDTWAAFWQARRSWVVRRAVEWLQAQRLPLDRLVRTHEPDRPRRARADEGHRVRPMEQRLGPEAELRDRIHDAVERMTLAELCELRIPARLLLDE